MKPGFKREAVGVFGAAIVVGCWIMFIADLLLVYALEVPNAEIGKLWPVLAVISTISYLTLLKRSESENDD